ncbi:MAG: UTP--glucose-1-phosphate uridylyltransferase [Planctomycetota bacterium]|jgi:UDP-N-acetylglucosamine/UDP-N-acetylgalactosamine diphosphorylase
MSLEIQKIQNLLKKYNQSHLLTFLDELSPGQKGKLLLQIKELDFEKVSKWVNTLVKNHSTEALPANFKPVNSYPPAPVNTQQKKIYENAIQIGKKLLSGGKVAAFVVAGGQGTRLGFDSPKGDYPISPLKNKTLFQIFAENITAASIKYGTDLSWYIMTSPLNHGQTENIFKSNDYYGLDQNNVIIFQQGTLPNFDFDGKIFLADKYSLALSPDGHGGSLKALYKSGAIENMKKRGIEFISYFQVDNPLIQIFDPLFIGLHSLDGAEMSSKALIKKTPHDKVGNFCLVDDKVTVIEYSDLPDELAEQRNQDGSLVFNLGSIAIHLINRHYVEHLNKEDFALKLHRAVKKIQYIDEDGKLVKPSEPNGIKLESFVFDALPLTEKSIILQTIKEQEFAPLKNSSGINGPDDVKKRITARAADWLAFAGIKVPRMLDGSVDAIIEIAPSFALEKEDVMEKLDMVPEIKPADQLYLE